ncbi:putative quinol monooxygenase [Aspergillus clavatus NRRL 1]|uniref:Antibiotic biosynthesis monooxygenase, putative n=1 Tax=Aspergillus clavatus (strain ATCC 1007 / CBS 513.65 / DSM 816 / NCTC 3887 / NRRL 1 / QM 1276 / 107) TaxID=344612 RepID=A1CPS0_ASPCL|nr:antibiotic biosynthesis monooxygenase, putative [Aspergillus clavatus NRRL 1]EAW07641.1 antibiotic biosynthesis monooxygenase, putative [Aspergillus clavatus NRRL 1]
MSSDAIYNIVTLVPKPGKYDQVVDAFRTFSQHIEAHESKTQIYFAVRPEGTDELVIVEKYTDLANLKEHAATQEFKDFSRRIAPCLAKAPVMKKSGFLAGFDCRSKI